MIEPVIFRGEMKSFEIHGFKVDGEYSRVIIVRLYNDGNPIELVFKGVHGMKGIRFSSFGEIMVQVRDLSDRGWDRKAISVEEIVDQSFLFYCGAFSSGIVRKI